MNSTLEKQTRLIWIKYFNESLLPRVQIREYKIKYISVKIPETAMLFPGALYRTALDVAEGGCEVSRIRPESAKKSLVGGVYGEWDGGLGGGGSFSYIGNHDIWCMKMYDM